MKFMLRLSFFIVIVFSNNLSATEYAVVSSKKINKITLGQIKALFLKKTFCIGNKKIVPLNLPPRYKIRSSFEKKVLNMSFNRLKSYWTKQHYLGHRPPITMKSQESIKVFIKKIDGAIGYIELDKVDKELNIIYKWSD